MLKTRSRRGTLLAAVIVAAMAALPAGAARAATWVVDSAHSTLGFTGTQAGKGFVGRFLKWNAQIDFDPAHPEAGHATVTIDMASATTDDMQKDAALPQSDWFNVRAFPKAVFQATTFRPKGANAYEAVGTLTIRGISKPVVLPFTLDITGDSAHVRGALDLVRTDFGVGQGAWGKGDMVALAVGVTLDITATRKP